MKPSPENRSRALLALLSAPYTFQTRCAHVASNRSFIRKHLRRFMPSRPLSDERLPLHCVAGPRVSQLGGDDSAPFGLRFEPWSPAGEPAVSASLLLSRRAISVCAYCRRSSGRSMNMAYAVSRFLAFALFPSLSTRHWTAELLLTTHSAWSRPRRAV